MVLTTMYYLKFQAIERDLTVCLCSVRRYYNATPSAPIHRLHPELLEMIFNHLRDQPGSARLIGPMDRPTASYSPLARAMVVCHRWHAVIMQHASLWTEIDFTTQRPKAVRDLLERSRSACIVVRFGYPLLGDDAHTELMSLLRGHGHRTHRLEIEINWVKRTSEVLRSITRPMPCLRHLAFRVQQAAPNVHQISVAHYPNLRSLTLMGMLLLPTEPVLFLTHLYVTGHSPTETLLSLLTLLSFTPALESLELSGIDWSMVGVVPKSYPILPRLRVLKTTQHCTEHVVDAFISHLGHPILSDLTVTTVQPRGRSIPYLPETFVQAHTMTRLKITDTGHCGCGTLTLGSSGARLTMDFPNDIGASLTGAHSWPSFLDDIEDACISFDWDARVGKIAWLGSRVPKLKTLVIQCARWNQLVLAALASALRNTSPVYFPQLVFLGISAPSATREDIDLLAPALALRAQAVGHRLTVLKLQQSPEFVEDKYAVSEHVNRLEIVTRDSQTLWFPI